MPGDGIGKNVLKESVRVLDAVGFEANYVHGDIGWEFWCKEGNPLPDRTLKLLEEHKIGLFGAITSKPKDKAEAELDPELKGKGYVYYSPIVAMRQKYDLDICKRPCKTFKGNPLNFIRRGPNNTIEEPVIDTMIFRQNTEGLYGGVEWTNPPDQVYDALMTHKKMKAFATTPLDEMAISCRIITKKASQTIIRNAFQYAQQHKRKSVTLVEKPNVLRETSGLMLEEGRKIAAEYPSIPFKEVNVDAMCMWLVKNPQDYDILVSSNMFGDIISDLAAQLVGGLGFASSGNIGDSYAVFEPTHGSAPKYAGQYKVNPMAMLLTVKLMLEWLGEKKLAAHLEQAIAQVIKEGKVRTYDMGGTNTTLDVARAVASTFEKR